MGMRIETLDSVKDEEFQAFRRDIKQMCYQAVKTRDKWDKNQQALFHHPPVLDINPDLPMNTVKQFQHRKIFHNPHMVISSLQCYTVLSTIAHLLRKMKLKNLVSLFLMSHLSETLE